MDGHNRQDMDGIFTLSPASPIKERERDRHNLGSRG